MTNVKTSSPLKSTDVLYQVSNDLGEVNSFYNSFSDVGQKALPAFEKLEKACLL